MKTIVLFRHGKSDWDASYGRDHDRPLAKRGVRDAGLMGEFLTQTGLKPDLLVTSTAIRARTTMELAKESGKWSAEIRATEALYGTSANGTLDVIRSLPDSASSVVLAGHQPTWSSTVEALVGGGMIPMPTAAMARIDVDVEHWDEVAWGLGVLVWHMIPKALQGNVS